MFSKISSLIQNNIFFVSRQKTLLKRRKNTSKKQKVAKKKFLQHDPKGSYTHQLKLLQIQKQLDRKVSKNHHLNQLMDQLFYPDVRYANQQILNQNLLKISINPSQSKSLHKKQTKQRSQDIQQIEEYDQLKQQIYLCQIPSQLFELYLKNSQYFNHYHLSIFLQRLEYYFKNKERIQQRITYKWRQSLDKLKLTDVQKKKRKRCPYIFIEQQQLIRDQNWNKVIKDINKKIIISTQHIMNQNYQESNQLNEQNKTQKFHQNKQSNQTKELNQISDQQLIDQSYYSLQNNCDLLLYIKNSANYIPEEIYDSIVKKTLTILNLNQQQQQFQEKLPIFSHSEKVKLLQVLSLKAQAKSTLTKPLHIESPESSHKQQQIISSIGQNICEDVLKSSKCSAQGLGAVIESGKGQFQFLNSMILELAKPKILQFLSSTNLQRSINYISTFYNNGSIKDICFIQVLIFDIYRKLPYSINKISLLNFMSLIKDSKITFKQSQIAVNVSSIYPRVTQTIAKYLNRNQLTHEQVKFFLNSIYQNYPPYKLQSRTNILQMITTAIVKMGQGYKLEQLAQLLFKSTILGYRSKIFSKYVFQRYQKEYKSGMKQYKSSKIQLISDRNAKPNTLQEQASDVPSMNQVLLQQSLIMMMWSYVASLHSQNVTLPLNDMIQMYPLYIRSQDSMIEDLIEDLNIHLKDYNFFPIIKNKIDPLNIKDRKKAEIKKLIFIKTNTSQQYKYQYKQSFVVQCLQKLEEGKQPISEQVFENLISFFMRYQLILTGNNNKIKIPDRWNDSVKYIFNHREEFYKQIEIQFMNLVPQNKQGQISKIHKRILKILQRKQKQNTINLNTGKIYNESNKSYKLYELL